jgi:hypothetical protein
MAIAPIPLGDAEALLIAQAGWVQVTPGTLQFIQTGTMLDETGTPVPLPEPWVQFADTGDPTAIPPVPPQPQGYAWRAVLGVKLAAPAQPD